MENEKQMKSEQALVKKESDIANVLAEPAAGLMVNITSLLYLFFRRWVDERGELGF